jgi:hypothetical protein
VNYKHFITYVAFVAIIAGGLNEALVEVFSPNCSINIGNLPFGSLAPIIGLINGRITICASYGIGTCIQYDPTGRIQSQYTTMKYTHYVAPGENLHLNNNFSGALFTLPTYAADVSLGMHTIL